ncbi:acyl-CoA dehydrogenase family protein [Mycolicibacterium iranicum]|uniref:acyl-CoA dehydrogenase family protein n=1 Tax=Mycolicibacterium iranicum TaxID=912594 RepID=UPI000A15C159|nr:acyl-CoA dehydrogenase family protein [Mycolicibacterium iranicum]
MSTAVAGDAEVELFVSTTKAFLDREAPLTRVRELHELGIPFERDWWRRGAELGWAALLVPEQLGGGSVSGDGISELAMIAELFGRSAAPGPLLPVSAVAAALAASSTATAHADILDALVAGTCIGAWAVDEPGARFGDAPTTRATTTPAGFRIDGIKDRVEAGSTADVFLVTAHADDGCRQFLVPSDSPGVSVRQLAGVDLVRDYAAVEFDGVEVGSHAAVGTSSETAELVARQTLIVQLLQCAEMVGALDTVFDMTVAWAVDRHSFGRPLASYQALKHRFADMKTHLEACRAIVTQATRDVGARAEAAALSVSAAKAYVGEYSVNILQDCVQLHGGIGVTWEHDLHVFLRRVEVDRALFGSTEEHWERLFALAQAREERQ